MNCNIKFKVLFLLLLFAIISQISGIENTDLTFPEDFLIGTASSAYQVEGAWDVDGKSESVWDNFVHNNPEKIKDRSTGDVSCDSYHKYKEDVQLLKNIGLNHYRFSISWPRILPTGYANYINQDGLSYYHNLLDELDKHGIVPFVTIYHWDHPQSLEQFGGWLSEEMAFAFADYARVIFQEFAHRVKFFVTINEPSYYCNKGYRTGVYPPGRIMNGTGEYQCVHNMLKAHALAYHIYDKEFRNDFNGQIGIVIPANYAYGDQEAMDTHFAFDAGWQANPIFSKDGDYPKIMKEKVAKRSKIQGYKESRLPVFSQDWIEFIKGSADFFGLNFYTALYATKLAESEILNWPNDRGSTVAPISNLTISESPEFKPHARGIRDALIALRDKYDNIPVYITENGMPVANGTEDIFRIEFMYHYMKEMLIAMKEHGCNVKAYTVWSLLDSFEWSDGYQLHFGLHKVDLNDPSRKRTPKRSVDWLKAVMKNRKLLPPKYVL